MKKNTFLTLVAGLCLPFLSYLPGVFPGLMSPFLLMSFALGVALLRIEHPSWIDKHFQTIMLTLPALLFFAWNPRLLTGQTRTPKRTYVLVVLGVAYGAISLASSWSYGLRWQGFGYTLFVDVESVACIAILCFLFFRNWKGEPSFMWNLALHWVLFAWLAWFGFPYLGEPI